MFIDRMRLEKFIGALPEVKIGRTDHYYVRENTIFLSPDNKKLENTFWHELAHAYIYRSFRWGKFLIFSSGFFIIITLFFAMLTLGIWVFAIPSSWVITGILTIVCIMLIFIEERIVTHCGRLLRKEARQEILSKIKKDPSLRF